MRKILALAGGALLLGTFGCAGNSYEYQRRADNHQRKADYAAANRDYYKAANEQRKADEDRQRAARERIEEVEDQDLLPPP